MVAPACIHTVRWGDGASGSAAIPRRRVPGLTGVLPPMLPSRTCGSPTPVAATACPAAATAQCRGPARCPCTPLHRTCSCSSPQVGPCCQAAPPRLRAGASAAPRAVQACSSKFVGNGIKDVFGDRTMLKPMHMKGLPKTSWGYRLCMG